MVDIDHIISVQKFAGVEGNPNRDKFSVIVNPTGFEIYRVDGETGTMNCTLVNQDKYQWGADNCCMAMKSILIQRGIGS